MNEITYHLVYIMPPDRAVPKVSSISKIKRRQKQMPLSISCQPSYEEAYFASALSKSETEQPQHRQDNMASYAASEQMLHTMLSSQRNASIQTKLPRAVQRQDQEQKEALAQSTILAFHELYKQTYPFSR
ncbi:MAG: hypothetical protein ACE3JP_08175 [Ectobacillus sp.]